MVLTAAARMRAFAPQTLQETVFAKLSLLYRLASAGASHATGDGCSGGSGDRCARGRQSTL